MYQTISKVGKEYGIGKKKNSKQEIDIGTACMYSMELYLPHLQF